MSWLQQVKTSWRRRFRHRITRAGAAYILALAIVAGAAFVSANNLLFLILAAMVAAFLISGFAGRMALAGLELDVTLPPHVSARRPVQATFEVRNHKRFWPSFSVHVTGNGAAIYFPVIAGSAAVAQEVEMVFPRRGAYEQRSFEFRSQFPFGFAERRQEVEIRHNIVVYPCLDPRPEFEDMLNGVTDAISAHRSQEGEFHRIRPYETSDSLRHVDWKATAHTGAVQVREFAQDQRQAVIIFLDLNVPSEAAAWFERAVECAAYLAVELAGRGDNIRFLTQEGDVTIPATADIYNVLRYLALVVRQPGSRQPDKQQVVHVNNGDNSDDKTFHVVFTYFPDEMRELGWCTNEAGRMVGPQDLGEHG